MRVLVAGAKGQVGSELINQGRKLGLQMISANHSELDITMPKAVNKFITDQSPDIVINAAAYTAVDKAETEKEIAYAINGDGPAHISETCAKLKIPLLHISTDYIFDGSNNIPYQEDCRPNPQGIYGKSKLAGEITIKNTLPQHIILRVSWVFGASGNNFVRTMLRLGQEREELSVVADQHGCPTWAGDIATVLLNIADRYHKGETIPWGTYHYTGNLATTWHGFAQTIFTEAVALGMLDKAPMVQTITTEEYPTPAQRPQNSVLNCQKILQQLAISQPDWHIGLKNVLLNWKKQ